MSLSLSTDCTLSRLEYSAGLSILAAMTAVIAVWGYSKVCLVHSLSLPASRWGDEIIVVFSYIQGPSFYPPTPLLTFIHSLYIVLVYVASTGGLPWMAQGSLPFYILSRDLKTLLARHVVSQRPYLTPAVWCRLSPVPTTGGDSTGWGGGLWSQYRHPLPWCEKGTTCNQLQILYRR